MTPDFGNPGKWLEEEPKLRSSVLSFGAGAVGGWRCSFPGVVPGVKPGGPPSLTHLVRLVFEAFELVLLHLGDTGESPAEL